MNQMRGGAYAFSKYAPDEIQNSMFPMKKALMGGLWADAKTSISLPPPLFVCYAPGADLFLGGRHKNISAPPISRIFL